jgi:hypothetical protein
MRDIKQIKTEIESARAEYQDKVNSVAAAELYPLSQKIKQLQAELVATISAGAEACKACDNPPHGMEQQVAIKGQAMTIYEVGCLVCPDRRAQGFTPQLAVESWNSEKFLPPKEQAVA